MAFFVYHAPTETVRYELGVGLTAEKEQQLREYAFSVREREGIVGWTAGHRLPALIAEVNDDPRWKNITTGARTVVAVPVEHERDLRGVLMAVRTRSEPFTAQDERLLILFANQIAAAMELSRLFEAQTRRQHELEILREASLAFAATTARAALTTLILKFALRLVTAQNAFLFYYDNDTLTAGGMLWANDSPVKPENYTPRRRGFDLRGRETGGKMIVVDDVNTHPLFSNWRWGGSIIGMPLKAGGQVRAVLNVAQELPRPFAPEDLRALETFGDQAAAALENARHYEETQRRLRNAELLHRAGEALNHTLSFEAALEQLADFFMEATGAEACCISTLSPAADELRVMVDRDPIADSRLAPGTIGRLSAQGHLVRLMQEQRTLTFRADAPDLDESLRASMKKYHWCSLMVLPLFAGDSVIGFVELADQTQYRDFSGEAIRLTESLAHQAASALQNARFYQKVQQRVERLTLLHRIAMATGGAHNSDELVEIVEREIASVLPFDSLYLATYQSETNTVDFLSVIDNGARLAPFSLAARTRSDAAGHSGQVRGANQ